MGGDRVRSGGVATVVLGCLLGTAGNGWQPGAMPIPPEWSEAVSLALRRLARGVVGGRSSGAGAKRPQGTGCWSGVSDVS